MNWEQIRSEHLGKVELTYLNSPANGLPPQACWDYEAAETDKFQKYPGRYRMDFIFKTVPSIKAKVAKLINAADKEIALIPNFSIGFNLFVSDLNTNLKVMLFEGDYPSLTLPFTERGFTISWQQFDDYKIDLQQLEAQLISEKPAILALSHCQWLTGYVADIESIGQLCKMHNVMFIVDATQSIGATGIDVQKCNIDVLGASMYKWPLAGFGSGCMYASASVTKKFPSSTAGFNSNSWVEGKPVLISGMKNYEPGHHDQNSFNRLNFALDRIAHLHIDFIQARINELMDYLIDKLHEIPWKIIGDFPDENRLGIISIESKPGLAKYFIKQQIEVSERGGFIRLGVHYYNNTKDIDLFIQSLKSFKAT